MIKQKWAVDIDGKAVSVEYACSRLTGKTVLTVDGDSFTVRGKPFGIGLERRETILVGSSQAILEIEKNGSAKLVCRDGEVTEQ